MGSECCRVAMGATGGGLGAVGQLGAVWGGSYGVWVLWGSTWGWVLWGGWGGYGGVWLLWGGGNLGV